jgi:predicted DNA-binding transcriptional regulator AlpA
MKPSSDTTAERWYSVNTIADAIDGSRATVWRRVKNGDAPPLHQIGPGMTRGKASEWDEYLANPIAWRAAHRREALPEAA